MNIMQVFKKFPTQESCVAHIEKARWQGEPACVYCGSDKVSKHTETNRQSRWQCSQCQKSFSVTVGTIFHHTHLPLQIWFLAISLILNAKKGLSSRQLARDLELPVKTAWALAHRIRNAMKDDGALLCGIVEMDETYVGGKPRKGNDRDDDIDGGNKSTRGRGTKKTPVVGMVERNGSVKAQSVSKHELKGKDLQELVRKGIDMASSILLTDEYTGYNGMKKLMQHLTINHQKAYVDGWVHTNTIESFWAIVKRGIVGQFHKVSAKYLDKYLDEFCYRYNGRNTDSSTMFDMTVSRMLGV